MKKAFIIFSATILVASCGNSSDTKEKSTTEISKSTPTNDAEVTKGLELISKSDCFTCHKLTEASIGPAYALIAEKYKTMDAAAAIDSMVLQINKGGSGKWGSVPMTPHPDISKEDAQSMAHYIMSIKK